MNIQKINMTTFHNKAGINFKSTDTHQDPQLRQNNNFELPTTQEALAQTGVMIISSTKIIEHPDDGTTEKQNYTAVLKDGKVKEAETTIQYFNKDGENYGSVIEKEDIDEDDYDEE